MTAFDRFDPFAGRVTSALEEIAPTTRPAYLDDVLAQAAATRQRPRWTFPGRWLPMDTAIRRSDSGWAPSSRRRMFSANGFAPGHVRFEAARPCRAPGPSAIASTTGPCKPYRKLHAMDIYHAQR